MDNYVSTFAVYDNLGRVMIHVSSEDALDNVTF